MTRDSIRVVVARAFPALVAMVWNSNPPPVRDIDRDIVYATHGGEALTLDVIHPFGDAPHPVLMMIHGGGFVTGDKRLLDRHCRYFANNGILCVNVNYRLAPEHRYPAPIEDVAVALEWVKANVGRFGGDPSRVCVGGGSAGAYLAAMLAVRALDDRDGQERPAPAPTARDESRVESEFTFDGRGSFRALLLLNGVFDLVTTQKSRFPQAEWMCKTFMGERNRPTDEALRAASPIAYVDTRLAPALIVSGDKDSLAGESAAFHDAMVAHNVACEYRTYVGSGHGFFNWYWTANARACLADALAFLKRELGESISRPGEQTSSRRT